MQHLIAEGTKLMADLGLPQRQQRLEAEHKRLASQTLKVAVIGQFKVLKSVVRFFCRFLWPERPSMAGSRGNGGQGRRSEIPSGQVGMNSCAMQPW